MCFFLFDTFQRTEVQLKSTDFPVWKRVNWNCTPMMANSRKESTQILQRNNGLQNLVYQDSLICYKATMNGL